MHLDFLKDLYRHMAWADARVWDSVRAMEAAAAEKTLIDPLLHLHAVQLSFLRVWKGEEVDWAGFKDAVTLTDVEGIARSYQAPASDFLAGLSDDGLSRVIRVPWEGHMERALGQSVQAVALADTLYQVVGHSTYHRAQINSRIRELGGEPAMVDYIVWAWLGKPDAAWGE